MERVFVSLLCRSFLLLLIVGLLAVFWLLGSFSPTLGMCRRCQHGDFHDRYNKFTHASLPQHRASQFTASSSYRPK